MHRGYKIVSVTPAGRKPYLEILHLHLMRQRHIIDKHRFWVNTLDPEDIAYIKNLAIQYPDFYEVERLPPGAFNGNFSIHYFFRNCIEADTVYVRFDDDVCFIADDAVERLVDYRLDNPDPFLIYPVIINNCLIADLLQQQGALSQKQGRAGYACMGEGWSNPLIAEQIHAEFLLALEANDIERFHMPDHILSEYERVSINCLAWRGKDFAEFDGEVGADEEQWLASDMPKELGKPNAICGDALVCHFAFCTQRHHLESKTTLLKSYHLAALRMLDEARS